MDHQDHLGLLRDGISSPGGVWAEFGSGRGAFTFALAELIGPEGAIYSVDKNQGALRDQDNSFQKRFTDHQPIIHYLNKDYVQPIALPPLNGLLMANTLHFHRHKAAILKLIHDYLVPNGCLILVEYNSDLGNTWVPYPLSFHSWRSLAEKVGFVGTRLLERVPSSFMGEIYSAISYKKLIGIDKC